MIDKLFVYYNNRITSTLMLMRSKDLVRDEKLAHLEAILKDLQHLQYTIETESSMISMEKLEEMKDVADADGAVEAKKTSKKN